LFPWKEFDAVVLERGVSLHKINTGEWHFSNTHQPPGMTTPAVAMAELKLRPVVASLPWKPKRVDLLLPATGGRLLDMYPTELMSKASRSLIYMMQSSLYHCLALARWYSDECTRHSEWLLRFPHNIDKQVFGPSDPYFEFEALVTAIVRGYDMLRYALWKKWGRGGSIPNSYERVVDAMVGCPREVAVRLQSSRDGAYSRAKGYRDCIQHYVDVGSSSWAMMELLRESVWSVIVRVPDNPEARSSNRWVFSGNHDALTLGWELCTELFGVIDVALGQGNLSSAKSNC
jgi:hypothetical protein